MIRRVKNLVTQLLIRPRQERLKIAGSAVVRSSVVLHSLRVIAAASVLVLSGVAQADDHTATSGGAAADSAPGVWLTRMSTAFAELNYDGVFSFYTGTDLASLRVVHMLDDGIERERLVHLNGAPREIVREGDSVLCILQPGDRLVAMGGSIPAGPFARAFIRDFSSVTNNYDLEMKGEGRIALRRAVRLLVKPKDEHRYGYRLWLDKETGLLLKSELVDMKRKRALEIFQFNQIAMGDEVQRSALEPDQPQGSVIDHLKVAEEASAEAAKMDWHAGWLPAGFEMAAADLRHAPATQQSVSALIYSDGLAAISVFIESMPSSASTNMISHKGATVSVTQSVRGPNNAQHLVTVVGEVPAKTASAVAQSITYSN